MLDSIGDNLRTSLLEKVKQLRSDLQKGKVPAAKLTAFREDLRLSRSLASGHRKTLLDQMDKALAEIDVLLAGTPQTRSFNKKTLVELSNALDALCKNIELTVEWQQLLEQHGLTSLKMEPSEELLALLRNWKSDPHSSGRGPERHDSEQPLHSFLPLPMPNLLPLISRGGRNSSGGGGGCLPAFLAFMSMPAGILVLIFLIFK